MTQINPFAGAIAQTPQAARLAQIDRDEQLHKAKAQQRATGLTDQKLDEYVEGADAVESVGDNAQHQDEQKRQKRKRARADTPNTTADDKTHLDIRA